MGASRPSVSAHRPGVRRLDGLARGLATCRRRASFDRACTQAASGVIDGCGDDGAPDAGISGPPPRSRPREPEPMTSRRQRSREHRRGACPSYCPGSWMRCSRIGHRWLCPPARCRAIAQPRQYLALGYLPSGGDVEARTTRPRVSTAPYGYGSVVICFGRPRRESAPRWVFRSHARRPPTDQWANSGAAAAQHEGGDRAAGDGSGGCMGCPVRDSAA